MTKPDLDALRLDAVKKQERWRMLGMMNTPVEYEEVVKSKAAYRKAYEDYMRAEQAYARAVRRMLKEEV